MVMFKVVWVQLSPCGKPWVVAAIDGKSDTPYLGMPLTAFLEEMGRGGWELGGMLPHEEHPKTHYAIFQKSASQ